MQLSQTPAGGLDRAPVVCVGRDPGSLCKTQERFISPLATDSSGQSLICSPNPSPHLIPPSLCCRPDKGLKLAPVSPTHTVLLNDTWKFGRNSWSLRYLSFLIRHFPSACLLAPEGTPISWSLTDPLAVLTHSYTLPEHRGQHHLRSVVGMLAAQLHDHGFPVYTQVLLNNEP
nr:glycine N-acyltransferase-like protein 3 [Chelonoidis abingdonii]